MRKTKFTEQRVVAILKELEAGATLADVTACIRTRSSLGGTSYSRIDERGISRLRQLDEENLRLNRVFAIAAAPLLPNGFSARSAKR